MKRPDKPTPTPPSRKVKQPYESPRITKLGAVNDLTAFDVSVRVP